MSVWLLMLGVVLPADVSKQLQTQVEQEHRINIF